MKHTWRRIGNDLAHRRHVELYAVAMLAFIFALLSVLGEVVPENLRWATLLAGMAFLVYHITVPETSTAVDALLQDRRGFDAVPLSSRLELAREIWIFGPSAVNILSHHCCDGLRRTVLARKSGLVQVAILNPEADQAVALAEKQLDGSVDYPLQTLRLSLKETVERLKLMRSWDVPGATHYRFVDYNPGFSMVAIDPNLRTGVVIVEIHGFHNETTDSRMHFELRGSDGSHWYSYWVDQFRHLWGSSTDPN